MTVRLFFALTPSPAESLAIDHWRQRMLPPFSHPVPPQNLHLTLVFLGEVEQRQLESIIEQADEVQGSSFSIKLTELGYFPKPRVLWIGPHDTPEEAIELARQLKRIPRRLGFKTERRDFQAHLTIARRCELPPPASASPPNFDLSFDTFGLFESRSVRGGVRYDRLAEWPLGDRAPIVNPTRPA